MLGRQVCPSPVLFDARFVLGRLVSRLARFFRLAIFLGDLGLGGFDTLSFDLVYTCFERLFSSSFVDDGFVQDLIGRLVDDLFLLSIAGVRFVLARPGEENLP